VLNGYSQTRKLKIHNPRMESPELVETNVEKSISPRRKRSKTVDYGKRTKKYVIGLNGEYQFDTVEEMRKWENENEPILKKSNDRFIGQSKNYPRIAEMLDNLLAVFWHPQVISMKQDVMDWQKITNKDRTVLKRIHAFFATSDGIVNENIDENFLSRIQSSEHRGFYEGQIGNECVHKLTYTNIVKTLIPDSEELDKILNAIEEDPIIKKKIEWAMRFMQKDVPFADQILAFICVEGIQFCASFLTIFYYKDLGLFNGITTANEYISRDESLHTQYGTHLYYYDLKHKSSRAESIIREAVELECEFMRDMLGPDGLPNFKTEDVCDYIKMVADRICRDIGMNPLYNTTNKFPFMEMLGMSSKTNTFERHVNDYVGRSIIKNDQELEIDDNF
jgi:ribonucleoside-diphosphate reductase subunit M2